MANRANSGNGTVRAKRINSVRLGWWSMRFCCGIPSTWRRLSSSYVTRGSRSPLPMLLGFRPWAIDISTSRGGTRLPWQSPLLRVACIHFVTLTSKMRSRNFPVFRSIASAPSEARLCQPEAGSGPGSPGQALGTACCVVVGNGCGEAYTER